MTLKRLGLILTTALLPAAANAEVIAPKVMVIAMFAAEAKPWQDNLELPNRIEVAGLPESAGTVACNADLCQMTTTMGYANAAASTMAVALSDKFDLSKTYFIIAGIAGVDPRNGTLGSAAWADHVVDAGLVHRIDDREAPSGWTSQIVGLGAKAPNEKPGWSAGTEVFLLNPALVQAAFEASKDVELADNEDATAYRRLYTQDAAKAEPGVMVCASVSADTYWHGAITAKEVEEHVSLLTDGKADYCMSQMEDNATLAALQRGAQAGRLDFGRVAVLRTASNFDRAHEGQDTAESLAAKSGGFASATENAFRVGNAFAQKIIAEWPSFENGVPKP
ncbi:purine-nucleoside phosphorylase [Paracoccus benzoatiresistens]|uniref:Purine nucleoside permease n=1 Tax=Paracoccus benzoatiresistens TaxID=2997341 RepID=A0ABT4J6F7_9RHOB|nr:purine nucleoside permease [Paracoccus sp. EF6]MCZ0962669.1 purine nucleoside permease [Paracoccus sp. EF6]